MKDIHILQLAAISTACFQNTRSTIKDRIGRDHEAWTQAYGDVCHAIDREIHLREELALACTERDMAVRLIGTLQQRCDTAEETTKNAVEYADRKGRANDARNARILDLQEEIEVLRSYGNKDCTKMADAALAEARKERNDSA